MADAKSRAPRLLFSAEDIAARVQGLAREIAAVPQKLDIAMPILVGGFVFAADLVRALSKGGVDLDVRCCGCVPMATNAWPVQFR